jgi:hypothetical protein
LLAETRIKNAREGESMSIMPEGESVRKAVKWISDRRQDGETASVGKMIEEAAERFDLSPKDEEFLFRFFSSDEEK